MCKAWQYEIINLPDEEVEKDDFDYSVDPHTARETVLQELDLAPTKTYKESSALQKEFTIANEVIGHLKYLKKWGYFDHFLFFLSPRSLADRVPACEELVDEQLGWRNWDKESICSLIKYRLLDLKFIGYSAEGLQLLAGDVLVYDIKQSVEQLVRKQKRD